MITAQARSLALGLLLLAAVPGTLDSSTASRPSRIYFLGSDYVNLQEWARSHGFQARWTVWKEQVKITSAYSTLLFDIDSRRAVVNGVSVWLSTAIAFRNGAAYISPRDLTTAINPVLFPVREPAGKTIKTICLDPGHGGKDPGNREGKHQEKRYALLLAEETKAALTKAGFKVIMTRTGDTYPELEERPQWAKKRGADLFLSLHFNSADSSAAKSVQGIETYCMTPARASSTNTRGGTDDAAPGNRLDSKNMLLAYHLQRSMLGKLGAEDRGVRRARFAVLRYAEMPAVLVEAGFMTHPTESQKIYSSSYRRQLAQAITAGILAYKQAIEAKP